MDRDRTSKALLGIGALLVGAGAWRATLDIPQYLRQRHELEQYGATTTDARRYHPMQDLAGHEMPAQERAISYDLFSAVLGLGLAQQAFKPY